MLLAAVAGKEHQDRAADGGRRAARKRAAESQDHRGTSAGKFETATRLSFRTSRLHL